METTDLSGKGETENARPAAADRPLRVLVPFNATALYGMERAVLEIFTAMRPAVEPHFVLTRTVRHRDLPLYREIVARGFSHSFLSDFWSWPKIGKPRSLRELLQILWAVTAGNLDVLRAAPSADMLYVPSLHYLNYAYLAAALLRLRGRRVIYHFHDLTPETPEWARIFELGRPLLTDVIHNTTLSRDWVLGRYPRLGETLNVSIPLITGLRSGDPDPRFLREFGDKQNLLFVGQLSPHKGADLLLEAFALVAAEFPDARLHLLGDTGSPEFEAKLQRLLARPELRDRCVRWGFRDDVHSFLRHAYLYVQPSRPSVFHESFGRGAVEAMAVGVPTVCLASGALQAIVRDGETGVVCPEETAESIAGGLRRFLADPAFRERCSTACVAEYARTYAEPVVRSQWRAFFLRRS